MSTYNKSYYLSNKVKFMERMKKYYNNNKIEILEQNKIYYENSRNNILEQKKKYYENSRNDKLEYLFYKCFWNNHNLSNEIISIMYSIKLDNKIKKFKIVN